MQKTKNTIQISGVKVETIELSRLENNTGQLKGLPKNPRTISDERFQKLKKSLQDDPEFLAIRELIVFPIKNKFVVIAGNMRLDALREIGEKSAICKILPKETPIEKLRAYTIKDNLPFGENSYDLLKLDWDKIELEDFGFEMPKFDENENQKDLSESIKTEFKIEIECENENHQEKTYNELLKQGYTCRILTL